MKHFFSLWAGLAMILVAAGNRPAAPIEIGARRELFVDRLLIASLQGAELRLQQPQPAGVALRLDRPWEGIVSGYVTVLRDGERFLMYYRGRPSTSRGDATAEAHEVTCVAESRDGVTWTRPNLGLFEVAGTRDNNVFLVEPKNVAHNFCPFLDPRPGVAREERFKAVGGTGSGGLFGFISSDGLRWKPVKDQALIKQGNFDAVLLSSRGGNRYDRTFHDQRLVAAGEEVAEEFVPPVEPAGVGAQQPFHPGDRFKMRLSPGCSLFECQLWNCEM